MPYWLLTSTTYGTWLPGDPRGSVTSEKESDSGDVRHENATYGDPYAGESQGLLRSSKQRLKGSPVIFTAAQAQAVVTQFQETCAHCGWRLEAVAIMANHFHVVLGCSDPVDGRKLLNDLKAYASRSLNRAFGEPASRRWWTSGGSRRRLLDEEALAAATHYVLQKQPNPLVTWSREPEA